MAQDRKPRLMTIGEVAKYLRIHKSTVYRLAKGKRIPASKVGNKWRFRKDVIDRWLTERENRRPR